MPRAVLWSSVLLRCLRDDGEHPVGTGELSIIDCCARLCGPRAPARNRLEIQSPPQLRPRLACERDVDAVTHRAAASVALGEHRHVARAELIDRHLDSGRLLVRLPLACRRT